MKWTKEQEQAIYTDGKDILVAAAAGSGKTAVLVERIIQKVISVKNPIDIDTLLVVTFTNAAAQEMRNRVGSALEKALEENPTSSHLKKQLSLLQQASISTLHSFCMNVVRKYAYLLDIDPAFRIADDMEIDLIKQDVIDELFEEWYGLEGEEQEVFFEVVDRFSSDRTDVHLEDLIRRLYTFSIQHPWPKHWLDELVKIYDVPEEWSEDKLVWLNIMKQEVENELHAIEHELNRAEEIARESDGPYHYLQAIESDRLNLNEAKKYLFQSWDPLQTFMTSSTFARLSSKRIDCNEEKKERVQKLRNSYRKRWNDMKDHWFSRNLSSHIEDLQKLKPSIQKLVELVKQFAKRYSTYKREKAIVDFSDLEHLCLQLLVDESSNIDKPKPSQVAYQFQQKFNEILIDEYQDTNLVQETIIRLLSRQSGSGNMFMVGDVKQSIYRFRHAEPSLFIDKYNEFQHHESSGVRIDLSSNFRSRQDVLIGANYIFRQIFDQELGEIHYDEKAELIYANKTYDSLQMSNASPELIIIDREEKDEDEVSIDRGKENYQELAVAQLEARAYAEKIKTWIGQKSEQPLQIADQKSGIQRDIKYQDIVILLRSMTWAPVIVDELKEQGIPVYAELSTGYFSAIEIQIMLSLLKIIDNPLQDIPLAAVLRSPIVGLNEEELTQIRLAEKSKTYYDALIRYIKENNNETTVKLERFLKQLRNFRQMAREGALSELIWEIYRETGYYDFVGGIPGGKQRQANLRALYDRARGYETTSFRGLFRFLRFVERMEERGDDLGAARALSEQEDVVRIMTIHKSKGLEFPVVIIGGMNRQFNLQDLNQKYILDKDFGFASKYIDPIKRITYPTLFFHAIQKKKLREQLSEEIRVLYVALTRAKEKLVMVSNVPSMEKKLESWQNVMDHPNWVLPTYFRVGARSYLDWVGPALLRHEDNHHLLDSDFSLEGVPESVHKDPSKWTVSIVHGSNLANLDDSFKEANEKYEDHIIQWKPIPLANKSLDEEVEKRLSFKYPYKHAVESRAKQTVTEIKRQREIIDEYSSQEFIQPFQPLAFKRPQFMQVERQVTGAERGTVYHTVMQHLPIKKVLNEEEITNHLYKLVEKEILTLEDIKIVDVGLIRKFYLSEIANLMMTKDAIYREVPFTLSLPANDVYTNWSNHTEERVLVQGVIDCLIRDEDGWIIIDYKTDEIKEDVSDQLIRKLNKRYETQMELYRRAVESIWNEQVKKTYLYFFTKQLVVEVPPN